MSLDLIQLRALYSPEDYNTVVETSATFERTSAEIRVGIEELS